MFCSLSSLPGGGLQAAQSGISQEYAAPHPMRIVDRVDDSRLTVLKGNTHPLATPANDRGVVLRLHGMEKGVRFQLGAQGVSIKLKS